MRNRTYAKQSRLALRSATRVAGLLAAITLLTLAIWGWRWYMTWLLWLSAFSGAGMIFEWINVRYNERSSTT